MGNPVNADRDYVRIAREYAEQVVSGEISACRWILHACRRQLDDLAKSERGEGRWRFDEQKAAHVCRFVELLPHIKGRWKSRNLLLEPWQCFALTVIFGWIDRETGYRRFRKALIVIPRKNGKTFLAAAIGLYLLALDGEPGAEVVSAATTRDQAKFSWEVAKRIVERTPRLRERFGVEALAHSITVESEAASFKPLSRDADSLEGLNPHGAIIDELHAHKTREVFDVLDEATGARTQPLIFIISTEGDNATGVFAEQVEYAQQVLSGRHEDDSYFSLIYTIDPEDDWTLADSWRKANPNLGVSVFEQDLEVRARQALKNAASQSSFLTKRLNVRVGAGEAYFNMLAWENVCKDVSLRIEDFYGEDCQIYLDLASESDIAAKVYLFRRRDGYCVFGKWYLPEDTLHRGHPNYDVYRGWAERGLIELTPGSATDYEFIERDLIEDSQNFTLTTPACDPYQATYLITRLQAQDIEVIKYGMTVPNFSEPMKHLSGMILSGKIRHNGDPVLSWMMGNVVAKRDVKENVYPRKARNENKIDGAVALIGALGMSQRQADESIPYTGLRVIG